MENRNGLKRREFLKLFGATGCAVALGGFPQVPSSFAKEAFPSKKITWIVGHQPGGSNDVVARGVSQYIEKYLRAISPSPDKVGMVVKNIVGGGQMRGLSALYHAKPDGYTIGVGGDELQIGNVLGTLGFDLFKITFIARLTCNSKVLLTGGRSNLYTWDDIVKASKKAPLRIAIGNFGTANHAAVIMFTDTTKLAAKPVFFGGTAGASAALIRGDAPLGLNSLNDIRSLIDAKEIRPVLSFSEKSEYPGVPSVKDIGFPELVEAIKSQKYVIAPPAMPADIKKILQDLLKKTMEDEEFLAWSKKIGQPFEPIFGPELDKLVKEVLDFFKGKEKILKEYMTEKKS